TDQPRPQRGRCDAGRGRPGRAGVDRAQRSARGMGARRWPRPGRHGQSVCAVLHHEGGRLGDRAGAVTADRRGARRLADSRQPGAGQRLRGPRVAADRGPRVSRALLVAAAVAVASCRVEPHRVFPPTVDAGPDLRTRPRATARLLDRIPGSVFALGDHAYPNGSDDDDVACYQTTWGRHRKRTHPVPGNHDYDVRGGSGYFAYFGVAAGEPGAGYYSYDLGDW